MEHAGMTENDRQLAPVGAKGTRLVERKLIRVQRPWHQKLPIAPKTGISVFLVIMLLAGAILSYQWYENGQFFSGFQQASRPAVSPPPDAALSEVEFYALPPAVQEAYAQNPECALDVRICPDRTQVGRTGPNCQFAECPPPDYSKLEEYDPDDPFAMF
ncbi:MAG: hypothetical protein WDZ94_01030 [Patescibacteria group bacterium]